MLDAPTSIQVELTNGDVYFPSDMPPKEVRKHVCKLDAFDDQFGYGVNVSFFPSLMCFLTIMPKLRHLLSNISSR